MVQDGKLGVRDPRTEHLIAKRWDGHEMVKCVGDCKFKDNLGVVIKCVTCFAPVWDFLEMKHAPQSVNTFDGEYESFTVSPSMLGYWNFWKLSGFGQFGTRIQSHFYLTSVFVGVYNVDVETTSGPDMCASFSRFYSFTGLIVHPSLHHPTYPPFPKIPGCWSFMEASLRCSMKRKVVNSPGCGSSLIPGFGGRRRKMARLWSWWNHWFW